MTTYDSHIYNLSIIIKKKYIYINIGKWGSWSYTFGGEYARKPNRTTFSKRS